jgi:hypothetical protein
MHIPHYRCQLTGLLAVSFLLTAFLLAACQTTTASNPATATARAERYIAQATEMALQVHETTLLDEKQATATAQQRLERLELVSTWPVVLSDTFDENLHAWVVGQETGEYADATFTIANGVYRWEATPHQGFIWWNTPEISTVADFYMSADLRQVSGPKEAYMGLVMALTDDDNFYVFSLRSTGEYSLDRFLNGQWHSLIQWTPLTVFLADETKHVEVVAEAGYISLFVNGTWLVDYEVQTLPTGQCGLAVGMDDVGESAAWEFENFEVRAISTEEEIYTPEATSLP